MGGHAEPGGDVFRVPTAIVRQSWNRSDWSAGCMASRGGEISGALLRRAAAVPATHAPLLAGGRLCIAEGSVVTHPGSTGSDWRLTAALVFAALAAAAGYALVHGIMREAVLSEI
jgi:hypothetical protein